MSLRIVAFTVMTLSCMVFLSQADDLPISSDGKAPRGDAVENSPPRQSTEFQLAADMKRTAKAKPSFSGREPAANSKNLPRDLNGLQPIHKALKHAFIAQQSMRDIKDYEAVFNKRVLIRGRMIDESMTMKLREKPFSVYLKYHQPHKGREVLFIDGMHDNKILAHETGLKGLAGTISLHPTSKLAMEGNVYPITEIGMSKLLEMVIDEWEQLISQDECKVLFYHQAKLGEIPCTAIEVSIQAPVDGTKYHISRLYFEKKNNLPVHVELFGFPSQAGEQPPLVEEYTYTQIKLNVGLNDHDFSTKNTAYKF